MGIIEYQTLLFHRSFLHDVSRSGAAPPECLGSHELGLHLGQAHLHAAIEALRAAAKVVAAAEAHRVPALPTRRDLPLVRSAELVPAAWNVKTVSPRNSAPILSDEIALLFSEQNALRLTCSLQRTC